MENIKYSDFQKLDIKIGTIISAEKIENGDKLLKIIVDFGEEQRQIMSGIAEWYDQKNLIGLQVPVLINLEPKTFRGHESFGMILMADSDEKPVLIHPSIKVNNGEVVR